MMKNPEDLGEFVLDILTTGTKAKVNRSEGQTVINKLKVTELEYY